MSVTFKQWLIDTYEPEELKDIAEHGCASCAPSGMIYYSETSALYDKFCDDLHEIVAEYTESVGEMPRYILDSFDSASSFKNAMVWTAAELVAYDLTSEFME